MASENLEQFEAVLRDPKLLATLSPGSRLSGPKQLGLFDGLYGTIFDYLLNETREHITKTRDKVPSRIVTDFLSRRKFYGQVRDLESTVIANQFPQLPPKDRYLSESLLNILRLVTQAQLHSTGRGQVGTVVFDTRFSLRSIPTNQLGEYTRVLNKESDLSEIDEVVGSSRAAWYSNYRKSLANVVSSGLPSLGKKR